MPGDGRVETRQAGLKCNPGHTLSLVALSPAVGTRLILTTPYHEVGYVTEG